MGRHRKSRAGWISYSSRVHLKRTLLGIDYKFGLAVISLIAALVLTLRYLA